MAQWSHVSGPGGGGFDPQRRLISTRQARGGGSSTGDKLMRNNGMLAGVIKIQRKASFM